MKTKVCYDKFREYYSYSDNVALRMSALMANGFNFYLDVRLFGVDYVVHKLMGNGKYLAYCVGVSS